MTNGICHAPRRRAILSAMTPYTEAVRRRVNRLKDLITDALLRLGVSANAGLSGQNFRDLRTVVM